jgi:hypothetical protein
MGSTAEENRDGIKCVDTFCPSSIPPQRPSLSPPATVNHLHVRMSAGSAFPDDVLGEILQYNKTATLSYFARASRNSALLARPRLYRDISVGRDKAPALFWTLANRASFGVWVGDKREVFCVVSQIAGPQPPPLRRPFFCPSLGRGHGALFC